MFKSFDSSASFTTLTTLAARQRSRLACFLFLGQFEPPPGLWRIGQVVLRNTHPLVLAVLLKGSRLQRLVRLVVEM